MILHILNRAQWAAAQVRGHYRPASLETEGFIHCSTIDQVIATANKYYCGQGDLVLLRIDERKLTSRLKFERPTSPEDARGQMLFPHIYGPLNLDAVIDTVELPAGADGLFCLPAMLRDPGPE